MAIELVEITRNTRGINSREIKFKAIGKYVEKTIQRDTRPAFNPDGTKQVDEKGNEIRLPLEKDKDGKNIYVDETVTEFVTDGVLTSYEDAYELVNGDEQVLLDCFVDGYNEWAYALESGKDELDGFIADLEMNDDQKAAFKKMARQVAKNYEMPMLEAAEEVKGTMLRARARLLARLSN